MALKRTSLEYVSGRLDSSTLVKLVVCFWSSDVPKNYVDEVLLALVRAVGWTLQLLVAFFDHLALVVLVLKKSKNSNSGKNNGDNQRNMRGILSIRKQRPHKRNLC